jgi:hypothetical protein
MQVLVRHKAGIDRADSQGETLLHILASEQDYEAIRWVLTYGPDKTALNIHGLMAWQVAETEAVRQLLRPSTHA